MPLFMDFHVISDITIEQVKNFHIADQAVQDRYHVKYHQFWVNEAAGSIFCLMEGPDKESCVTVHREAHGNITCEIVEVVPGMYNLFRRENHQIDRGLFLHEDGIADVGYRFVLAIDFVGNTNISSSADDKNLKLPYKTKAFALSKINKFQGEEIKHAGDDSMIAVFTAGDDAIGCAVEIRSELREKSKDQKEDEWNTAFKIGISGGRGITENDRFFEETIKLAQRLSLIAENRQIMATTLIEKMSTFNFNEISGSLPSIRVISPGEEKFLVRLFDIAEDRLTDKNFSVESLSRDIGISRPQLYRKIMSITGRSPNVFIRNLRMQKAFSLIRKKQHNISEIALEVGINNPSYFSKCFQEKYGIIPSRVMC